MPNLPNRIFISSNLSNLYSVLFNIHIVKSAEFFQWKSFTGVWFTPPPPNTRSLQVKLLEPVLNNTLFNGIEDVQNYVKIEHFSYFKMLCCKTSGERKCDESKRFIFNKSSMYDLWWKISLKILVTNCNLKTWVKISPFVETALYKFDTLNKNIRRPFFEKTRVLWYHKYRTTPTIDLQTQNLNFATFSTSQTHKAGNHTASKHPVNGIH